MDEVGGEGVPWAVSPRRERGVRVNSTVKTIMFWVFILISLVLLWGVVQKSTSAGKDTEVGYSDLLDKIEAGRCRMSRYRGPSSTAT